MEMIQLAIIGTTITIFGAILKSIIQLVRKKNEKVIVREVEVQIPEIVNQQPPIEAFIPVVKSQDMKNYDIFMATYSNNSNIETVYRPGSTVTCQFGLAEGYRYYVKGTNRLWDDSFSIEKREMRWGYVRPHFGVDQARAESYQMKQENKIVKDVIKSPFDFNRTQIVDYGNYSFGSLISLFNDEFEFEFRIAHMDPKKDILPWSLNRLTQRGSFDKGWILGSAGTYGYSSGAHTHTEVKSYDDSCEVLDILLDEKYGDKARKEYTPSQIIKEYKMHSNFSNASDKVILDDWESWKRSKKILFANQYKMVRIDPVDNKTVRTWYSSYMLFKV